MKIKRVLQGYIDIGGQASRYSRALMLQGCYSESWAYDQVLKDEPIDKRLQLDKSGMFDGRLRKFVYFLEAFRKFNVWHIHKGFTLFHNARDLELARRAGKFIIIHYRGREIRPTMNTHELSPKIREKVLREQDIANKIFVKDGQLAELIAPYVKHPIVFPNIVDVSKLKIDRFLPDDFHDERRKLRVVHIPSNPKYKGTDLIRQAIKRIEDKIDYSEFSGLPHRELLEKYWQADVIVDQVLTGTYGNASLEAMALGRCVVNYLKKEFMLYEPEQPPIVHAAPEQLTEVLAHLCENRKLVWQAGEMGKIFVDRHHSFQGVGRKLLEYYSDEE